MSTAQLTVAVLVLAVLLPVLGVLEFVVASALRRRLVHLPSRLGTVLFAGGSFLSFLPWIWIVALVLLAAWARFDAGHWPTSEYDFVSGAWTGGPHPSEYDPFRLVLAITAPLCVAELVLLPGLFAVLRAAGRPLGHVRALAFSTGMAAFLYLWIADPGGFVRWAFGD